MLNRNNFLTLATFGLAALISNFVAADDIDKNWHRFRGPDGNGVSETAKPPVRWSADSQNLKWKVEMPGKSHSSPIVWGDKVFMMTAVDTGKKSTNDSSGGSGDKKANPQDSRQSDDDRAERPPRDERQGRRGRRGGRGRGRSAKPTTLHEFWIICLNRKDGSVAWKKKANEAVPHEGVHSTNNFCAGSPVTDGKHIYCSFGSFGIYCYDMDGNKVWDRDLGDMQTRNSFGEGASAALYKDKLAMIWDHEGQSFLELMDAKTGKKIWRTNRDEDKTNWATPRFVDHDGKTQIVINGYKVKSYDMKDGKLIWECGGQTGNAIPTPIVDGDNVICMTGWRNSVSYAIPLSSKGDVTDSEKIVWNSRSLGPYVASGVLYKGTLYGTKTTQGYLTALDSKTGDTVIKTTRLNGIASIYSSLVAANNHVYLTGRSGKTLVMKHGKTLDIVSENDLGEPVDSTPALVDNQILIRGAKHLFCFED